MYKGALAGIALFLASATGAMAAPTVTTVAQNIVVTSEFLPGLLTAIAYALGLVFGVTGILKLKAHVEKPDNTPLRSSIIRFLVGGALFALPMVYNAMRTAFDGGVATAFDPSNFSITGFLSGGLGAFAALLGGLFGGGVVSIPDLNGVMANIILSLQGLPGLITAGAYALGILMGVSGLLKIKDHVENPDQTGMREGVVRLLAGGAFFAIPTIYSAMASLVVGSNHTSVVGLIGNALQAVGFSFSSYAGLGGNGLCDPTAGILGSSVGDKLCSILLHAGAFPAFLTALSYLFGLVLGFWAILKLRDHALNPQQTSIWEGVSRLVAGGAFFSLPFVVSVMKTTLTSASVAGFATFVTVTGYNEAASCRGPGGLIRQIINFFGGGGGNNNTPGGGLDNALACMMNDILGPTHVVLNFFAFVAGMIFIMIGISRLTKSAQEGARGPGGLGTMMTFLAGGALISYNEMLRALTSTFSFGIAGGLLPTTATFAKLSYTTGMTTAELSHAHTVISAIIKFMILVGLISFVRGIFIMRSVAEGNGQASVMSGVTHLVGGALAVNLGPVLNAVQTTLGISGFGITFS